MGSVGCEEVVHKFSCTKPQSSEEKTILVESALTSHRSRSNNKSDLKFIKSALSVFRSATKN